MRVRKLVVTAVLGGLAFIAGCGGGGAAGEPLMSGSLTGEYRGRTFTPMFGFATLHDGDSWIGVGDGPLNCASPQQNDPPAGTNAVFTVPEFAIGTYSSRVVQIYDNVGEFSGTGSNRGTIEITAVSDASVAGSVSYSYTDDEARTYGLSGTFEVFRCPG
jgi:hypothetical protein